MKVEIPLEKKLGDLERMEGADVPAGHQEELRGINVVGGDQQYVSMEKILSQQEVVVVGIMPAGEMAAISRAEIQRILDRDMGLTIPLGPRRNGGMGGHRLQGERGANRAGLDIVMGSMGRNTWGVANRAIVEVICMLERVAAADGLAAAKAERRRTMEEAVAEARRL